MNILLTGGTGLIGKQLGIELVKKGHRVIGVTRSKTEALSNAPYPAEWIEANLSTSVPDLSSYKIDGVIHLAGENVGEKNWSTAQKEKIKHSRTNGTKHLVQALKAQDSLRFFIGASAIGFYGSTQVDFSATENTKRGSDFLSEVTDEWEKASLELPDHVRRVLYRIGVVLTPEGGALPKMLFPAQVFASSHLGSGYQWVSWIHMKDVLNAFIFAAEMPSLEGIYNLVSPNSSQQKDLARHIRLRLQALSGPPVPAFMLKTLLGEQASLALNSLRVSSEKLLAAGFAFKFPQLSRALKDLLKDWRGGIAVKTFRQYFPLPREKVFEFFSECRNLEKITPKMLNFHMNTMSTDRLTAGTLIDYNLKVRGLPIHWITKITEWNPPDHFTDIQLKGPYSFWEHTHFFEDLGEGTLMTDRVKYKVPVGLIGRMATQAWIDADIENIFKYRRKTVPALL